MAKTHASPCATALRLPTIPALQWARRENGFAERRLPACKALMWKTESPGGGCGAPVFMPNPMHVLWGPAVTKSRWFTSRSMTYSTDMAASLGWVFLGLLAMSQVWRGAQSTKRWIALACRSTILADGPVSSHRGQYETCGCPLPFFIFCPSFCLLWERPASGSLDGQRWDLHGGGRGARHGAMMRLLAQGMRGWPPHHY